MAAPAAPPTTPKRGIHHGVVRYGLSVKNLIQPAAYTTGHAGPQDADSRKSVIEATAFVAGYTTTRCRAAIGGAGMELLRRRYFHS
jgi:hypothetical protein